MDAESLERAITKMERELLALKTSHQIGVGTIRFYEATLAIEEQANITIEIKIADGEPLPPFLFLILPIGVVLTPSVNEETGIASAFYGSTQSQTGDIVAVSSSMIEYMRRR